METKGVASHPSPVTTLNTYAPEPITHETFVQAVCEEFESVYTKPGEGKMEIKVVEEGLAIEEKIWKGVEEMKTWDWTFGQTPEFSNVVEREFDFGRVVSHSAIPGDRLMIIS
jgi:lipoate-protein ligase A